jgi:hypothetical protein
MLNGINVVMQTMENLDRRKYSDAGRPLLHLHCFTAPSNQCFVFFSFGQTFSHHYLEKKVDQDMKLLHIEDRLTVHLKIVFSCHKSRVYLLKFIRSQ